MIALEAMAKASFPVRSDEYEEGSAKRREYLGALESLLDALAATSHTPLLMVCLGASSF